MRKVCLKKSTLLGYNLNVIKFTYLNRLMAFDTHIPYVATTPIQLQDAGYSHFSMKFPCAPFFLHSLVGGCGSLSSPPEMGCVQGE